jgi:aminoglycoside phosphotransferase
MHWRTWRWCAEDERTVTFVAVDGAGWTRLVREGALLGLWARRGAPVPRVIDEDPVARRQVRERLTGATGDEIVRRIGTDQVFADRLATVYGELAALLHGAVPYREAVALGWTPRPRIELDDVVARLRGWGLDDLADQLAMVRPWLDAPRSADLLIHGDLHFHNMVVDEGGTIEGVFDVDGAGLDEGWTDLQYVHSLGAHFARRAIDSYAARIGVARDDEAVRRAHVRIAFEHFCWYERDAPRFPSLIGWAKEAVRTLCPSSRR